MTTLRLGTVVLSALVLQASLLAEIRIVGVSVDILLVLSVAGGLAAGADRGAAIGFACGLAMDVLLATPFGLSALAYCLTGFVVGSLHEFVLRASWWFAVGIGAAGGAFGVLCFVGAGELLGQPLAVTPGLWRIVVVSAVAAGILVLPAVRLLRWALTGPSEPRAAVL